MKRRTDELALTEDEISALGSGRTPDLVRQFVARQQQSVGVRTSAFRKVAALARAEREALTEIRLLQIARERVGAASMPAPDSPILASGVTMPPMLDAPSDAKVVHGD